MVVVSEHCVLILPGLWEKYSHPFKYWTGDTVQATLTQKAHSVSPLTNQQKSRLFKSPFANKLALVYDIYGGFSLGYHDLVGYFRFTQVLDDQL